MKNWDTYKNYTGDDLGACYTKASTTFRLWAPSASKVLLTLYSTGDGDTKLREIPMSKDCDDTYLVEVFEDLKNVYYTYSVTVDGVTRETCDPYAKACGVNGKRAMVVDLPSTNPEGFAEDLGPELSRYTDAIVCEISVADITSEDNCGVIHKGKFLGLTEAGTKSANGVPTGLDYLTKLGVTHVQLMPSYDFGSIDESKCETYNWGYDPVNYNVPEGSYSTDPFHGEVRVREFKEMVMALHRRGLGVIMDVVYNHTFDVENCPLHRAVPNYYHRQYPDGTYSNSSACGNEIASERPMVRKYIIDSVCYWAREYHIDGFRFDLMGIIDMETMQMVRDALKEINPSIIIYGEGWAGGPSVFPEEARAMKKYISKMDGIGAFSDDIRDMMRGSVFYHDHRGYISDPAVVENPKNAVAYSVVGASAHPQVDYNMYTYSQGPWAKNPCEVVNYASCHDNLTLWDKLMVSVGHQTEATRLAMNRLAVAMVMTSQGIPFFLLGEEIARSKPVEGSDFPSENSYDLPLYTNMLRYENALRYEELLAYYRGMIAIRKSHKAFRMDKAEEVANRLHFVEQDHPYVVSYEIQMEDELVFVAYNPAQEEVEVKLPATGTFAVLAKENRAQNTAFDAASGSVKMSGISAFIAVKKL